MIGSAPATAQADDAYARLAKRERKPPNPPRDLSAIWEALMPLASASPVIRARVDHWAASKGATLETLERMDVRCRVNRHGGVVIAYSVRCAETDQLPAGTVVAIKFRDLDPEAQPGKWCAPGSRLAYPALPSVYGASDPRRLFVAEGESDAAWLLTRADARDAVMCLHGGAGLFYVEWAEIVPASAQVLIATDNDYDRRLGNIGDELAARLQEAVPRAKRLRPPYPARDWCEVTA